MSPLEDIRLRDAKAVEFMDALGISQDRVRELAAENQRLRVQLGGVKALAKLWEEDASEIEREAGLRRDVRLRTHADVNRFHAAAIRDLFRETPTDDVVDAEIVCGQSSRMFGVAECGLPDGHEGQHRDSKTEWQWGRYGKA